MTRPDDTPKTPGEIEAALQAVDDATWSLYRLELKGAEETKERAERSGPSLAAIHYRNARRAEADARQKRDAALLATRRARQELFPTHVPGYLRDYRPTQRPEEVK